MAPFIVDKGFECVVYCDRGSFDKPKYKGVTLEFLNITKSENPLKYYFQSLKRAARECDIVYVAGTGGALSTLSLKANKQ